MKVSAIIVAACMMTVCICFLGNPASAAVEGWEEPIMVQANLDYAQAETLRVDDQGNALVVWEQPEGNTSDEALWARQYNRVLGWSEPEKIYDGEFWWGYTEMDMASNGRAVAAWATYSVVSSSLQLYARMFDPVSGWGQMLEIATGVASLGDLEVAINSDGVAVCIWSAIGVLTASVYETDSGWSAPVSISSGGSDSTAAVDASGSALLIWSAGNPSVVMSARYVPGEGWAAPSTISGTVGGSMATMDMDDSGNAMAAWMVYDGTPYTMYASLYSQGVGWGIPTEIGPADDGRYPYSIGVSTGREGEYLVIWQQSNLEYTKSVWTKRWTASAGWEESVKMSGDGYVSMWPRISANHDGLAVAVWTQGGSESLLDVRISRYTPGIGWTAPSVIDNSDTLNAFFGYAEIDPLGNIVATWKLDTGQCWLWGAAYKAYWAPDVMIAEPLDGMITAESLVTIRGYVEAYADLTVNEVPVQVQPDGSFEALVELVPGDNLIVARATDEVGNSTETSVIVTMVGGSSEDPVAVTDITAMKNWKTFRFDGRSSTDDARVVTYLWDFGDGEYACSKMCVHTYQKAGEYVVTLTVWDGDGNSDSASETLFVRQPSVGT